MALPGGYTAQAYIETTNYNQYVTYGQTSRMDEIEIDVEFTDLPSTGADVLFGARDYNTNYLLLLGVALVSGEYKYFLQTADGAVSSQTSILTPYLSDRHTIKISGTNSAQSLYIDGTLIGSKSYSGSAASPVPNSAFFGYAAMNSGTSYAVYVGDAKAKIYGVTVRSAGYAVTRTLVPAKRGGDSSFGLYDTTYNVFHPGSAGMTGWDARDLAAPATITVPSTIMEGQPYSVTWDASVSEGLKIYMLERAVNNGAFEQIYLGTDLSYTDTAQTSWNYVQYRVRVTDGANRSPYTVSQLQEVSRPSGPPDPPAYITVSDNIVVGGSFYIEWGASPSYVTGYKIERSVNGASFESIGTATVTRIMDIARTGWRTVQYQVRATNGVYDSADVVSNVMPVADPAARPSPPPSVTVPATILAGTSFTVTWEASAAPDVIGYKIGRSVDGGVTYTALGTVIGLSYTDIALSEWSTVRYRVSATDGTYDSEYTVSGEGTIITLPAAPSSISIPASIAAGSSYSVTWTASSSAGVTGYQLERSTNGGSTFTQIYSGSSLSFTDTALSEWSTVQYRVRATNGTYYSEYTESEERVVDNPASQPDPPASITLPATITGGSSYYVTWTASPSASVTGYQLERSTDGGSTYTQIYSGTALTYRDTAQTTWSTVRYRVRAVNGPYYSSYISAERTVNPPAAQLNPPSSIAVPNSITEGDLFSVSWGQSSSASVTGYELWRKVNSGAYTLVYSGAEFIYWDTAQASWNTVQYRVRATNGTDYSGFKTAAQRTVSHSPAPPTPPPHNYSVEYNDYLTALGKPFRKLVRLEFLQPDDTVAFALGGAGQRIPAAGRDSRCFLQSGSVSVNLANGARRKATVVLGNRDGAFDYAVGKLWFGQRVRISMGMRLPKGKDFYFSMGIFYIENPSVLYSPGERTTTLNLTDKWSYLDGSLFGTLEAAYSVNAGTNIFLAIDSLIHMSKYTYLSTLVRQDMIDPTDASYTSFFNGKTYQASRSDGSIATDIAMTDTPYAITENRGSSMGALILKLNEMLAGWIGYDASGSLRLEPSQDDIDDADKPVLFAFTPENSLLVSMTETAQVSSVFNDVTVAGQGLTNAAVWARAVNEDPASDTNINLIGRRVWTEEKADYWNTDQCASLARWYLKRRMVLQKAVTIECGQMFHLSENRVVSVKRTDKPGAPVEKHLIQGFTIPIGETGSMSISCTSVNDIPDFTVTTSVSS